MIKSHVITINEIDAIEWALEELETKLSAIELLKNTVGIVSAHMDFIDSGIYAAIAKALPFPLAGMTTFSQTANGDTGMFLLTIMVLTSDDCEFACGHSEAITTDSDIGEMVRTCYAATRSKLKDEPKLAFLYTPFPEEHQFSVSCHGLRALSAANDKLPVFGSMACCELEKIYEAKVIFGEEASNEHFALVLVSGDITPQFKVGAITKDAVIISSVGVVTAAKENFVSEINGINIKKFFEQMDYFIGKDIRETALSSILIAETKDETGRLLSSRAQGILMLTDEHAVLEDFIEPGTVLSLAAMTKETVITTTEETVAWIKEHGQGKTALLYSCLSRWLAAADESAREYAIISEGLADIHYQASYSGGELCPASVAGEKMLNAKHSSSVIACVF